MWNLKCLLLLAMAQHGLRLFRVAWWCFWSMTWVFCYVLKTFEVPHPCSLKPENWGGRPAFYRFKSWFYTGDIPPVNLNLLGFNHGTGWSKSSLALSCHGLLHSPPACSLPPPFISTYQLGGSLWKANPCLLPPFSPNSLVGLTCKNAHYLGPT
jgi:hypothetical protein